MIDVPSFALLSIVAIAVIIIVNALKKLSSEIDEIWKDIRELENTIYEIDEKVSKLEERVANLEKSFEVDKNDSI